MDHSTIQWHCASNSHSFDYCFPLCVRYFYIFHVCDSLFIISTYISLYTSIDLRNEENSVKYAGMKCVCEKYKSNSIKWCNNRKTEKKQMKIQCGAASKQSPIQALGWIKKLPASSVLPTLPLVPLVRVRWNQKDACKAEKRHRRTHKNVLTTSRRWWCHDNKKRTKHTHTLHNRTLTTVSEHRQS